MRVWVCSDTEVFEAFSSFIKSKGLATTADEHSLGFSYFCATQNEERILGVLLVPPQEQIIFSALQWIHKSWQTSEFIAFTSLKAMNPESLPKPGCSIAIPKRCLRSAGRGDLRNGPLLYEEMMFSDTVQIALADTFDFAPEILMDAELNIFSGFDLGSEESFERTIEEQVKCFSWDYLSGEILQSCRRLAVRCGGLYVLSEKRDYKMGALDTFFKSYPFVHLDEDVSPKKE